MNTIELQNKIIRKVLQVTDKKLLDYLNDFLNQNSPHYRLTDFEKSVIQESLAEYREGKVITNEEVFLRNEEWLKE